MVHCVEGKSRSAALISYYLMRKYQIPFPEASEFLSFARPTVDMNKGFLNQLSKIKLPKKEQEQEAIFV
jgi:protein-tyrosine phosphatase